MNFKIFCLLSTASFMTLAQSSSESLSNNQINLIQRARKAAGANAATTLKDLEKIEENLAASNGSTYNAQQSAQTVAKNAKGKAAFAKLTDDDKDRSTNNWMANCKNGAAACMWTVGTGDNPNTQVCDASLVAGGVPVHCHGVVIQEGQLENAKKVMQFIQLGDHVTQRGYSGSVAGFNSCDCIENLAVTTRCDASELIASPKGLLADGTPDPLNKNNFQAAGGNNLANAFKKANAGKAVDANLVGNCNGAAGQAALKTQQSKLQAGEIGVKAYKSSLAEAATTSSTKSSTPAKSN